MEQSNTSYVNRRCRLYRPFIAPLPINSAPVALGQQWSYLSCTYPILRTPHPMQVHMSFLQSDTSGEPEYEGHAVDLVAAPYKHNTWHTIWLRVYSALPMFTLHSQLGSSLPLAPSTKLKRLQSIHFSQDKGEVKGLLIFVVVWGGGRLSRRA